MRLRTTVAALAASAAAFAAVADEARAQDVVDLEVVGNAAVQGTIRPAGDRERFRIGVGRGTKIRAVAKAKAKKGPFVPAVELSGPPTDDTLVAGTRKGRASSLRTPTPLAVGGVHGIRVTSGTGADGDYVLTFVLTPQRSFRANGAAAPSETGIEMVFGAPPGAKARIVLSATKSGFVPALDELVAPSGASTPLSGARTAPLPLAQGGDWKVRFHDGGTAGGAWACRVVLTLPRKRTTRINIGAAALTGNFAGEQPVFGRLVTPGDGDFLLDPPDSGGALDGAQLLIPGGAVPSPVVVSVSQVPPFAPGDGDNPAGPAVDFSPDGLKFNSDATATIPYDPSQFTDPAAELEVYVVEGGGGPRKVEPRSLLDFSQPGLVTFPISGFSTYMAASSRPRALTGGWIVGSLYAVAHPDFGAEAGVDVGRLEFTADPSAPQYFLDFSGTFSEWSRTGFPPAGGPDPSARTQQLFESEAGTWSESGGSTGLVDLVSVDQDQSRLVRVPGGDVLLLSPPDDNDYEAAFAFALRGVEGSPTLTTVAGSWHVLVVGAEAEETGGNPRTVSLATQTALGTAVFGTDGRAAFTIDQDVTADSGYPNGRWSTQTGRFQGAGRLEAGDRTEGQLLLSLPDGDSEIGLTPPFQLHACLDGDVLLGVPQFPNAAPELFLFVRQARGLGRASLSGPADFLAFTRLLSDSTETTRPQNLYGAVDAGNRIYDAKGGFTSLPAFGRVVGHDVAGDPTFSGTNEPTGGGTYTLSSIGAYRESTGLRGVVARSGEVLFGVANGGGRSQFVIAVPGLNYFVD